MTATVYRLFDRDGALLYVGMSASTFARWSSHSKAKPWWTDVQRCEVEHLPDREAAAARELEVIRSERPRYNVIGLPLLASVEPLPPTDDEKFYGLSEIAMVLGARPATVAQWHRRGRLPEPTERLAMGPLWRAGEIEPWIAAYRQRGEGGA